MASNRPTRASKAAPKRAKKAAPKAKPKGKPGPKPSGKTAKQRGAEQRARMAERSREQSQSVSEVGELAAVENPERREACRLDLHKFLTTYFPASTGLTPFSEDHHRVIKRIEGCVLRGGRFLNVVYRGFAKTTITENAALWAVLYGHRRFVAIFGADETAAAGSVDSIQTELEGNDLLNEDFPEVCQAVRALEGKPQRCGGQCYRVKGGCRKCEGKGCPECDGSGDRLDRTHIVWRSDHVVLPTLPGSVASGAILAARGITGGFRGLKVKLPDGTQQRPDQVIADDIQTDVSAGSPVQVSKTLSTLRKAVTKLGGHRKGLAIVINATVICTDDAIDKLLKDPAWQSERVPMVRQWPEAHKTLWLEEYARIRKDYDPALLGDQERAHRDATEFYQSRRAEMDAGAVVSWDNCFDHETEISALQHAYNALIDDGEEAFASEYMVKPLVTATEQAGASRESLLAKMNGIPRGTVPRWATRLTAGVDVQQALLYWTVAAWSEDFTGHVVSYGTFPDQHRSYFALRDARPTLAEATGEPSPESQIFKGLSMLADVLLGREWLRDDGTTMRVERMLVDRGNWAEIIKRWARQSGRPEVLPSIGRAPGPERAQLSEWKVRDGERRGYQSIISKEGVVFDSSAWKSFVFNRFATPEPSRGCLTLHADPVSSHGMLLDHLTSEKPQEVENKTTQRKRIVWTKPDPGRDNHFLDTLVLAAVAANVQGVRLAEVAATPTQPRRVNYSEMRQRARER